MSRRSTVARALVAASVLALGACGGSASRSPAASPKQPGPPAASAVRWKTFTSAEGGFSISMPEATQERRAAEGPVQMHLVTSNDEHGTSYEATYFDMPRALEPHEKAELLDKIQVGLTHGPGVSLLEKRDVVTVGIETREFVLGLPEKHAGTWRIFYVGGTRMFQLSVAGRAGDRLDAGTKAFFESFRLL